MAFHTQMPASSRAPIFAGHALAAAAAPAGTFAPGTKVVVGKHKVVIQRYFAEGGFAHVYLVKMPEPMYGTDVAVLKRVAVPDKESLANMRTEVETMKKLKGHCAIVTYYDSHASQLQGGGYEVFLLMEFCNGGGLIDFMNTRLQHRLTEPEVLKIFSDVTEGVACMHYLNPPLLHRDLKVENVLINETSRGKCYLVCDFGSTAPIRKAGKTAEECRQILEDVMKHTTQQYRSPEMVDPHNGQDIDEKSDIWALGVFLYKLCYFTTPFEDQGQLAILNASFKFPAHPVYSDRLKKLIASMLQVSPKQRPNVYQVLAEACRMQGIEVPIKDIYSSPTATASNARHSQPLPPSPPTIAMSPPTVGAVFSSPQQQVPVIPHVERMARGRPTTAGPLQASMTKPSLSPGRVVNNDPFAALDSKSPLLQQDDISSRFPSLDQFSLLHEQGSKFEFEPSTSSTKPKDLGQRVTEKLADDFFATAAPKPAHSAPPFNTPAANSISRAQRIISGTPELQATIQHQKPLETVRPVSPVKPHKPSSYVSHGVQTSPDAPPMEKSRSQQQQYVPPPIHRLPPADDHHRSVSLSRGPTPMTTDRAFLTESPRPQSVSKHRSFQYSLSQNPSPRASLDNVRPNIEQRESSRPRPSSAYLGSSKEPSHQPSSKSYFLPKVLPGSHTSSKDVSPARHSEDISRTPSPLSSDSAINSNVEFLKQMEQEENKDKRRSKQKHTKRNSLPIRFAEKFGETFRRFENNNNDNGSRTPSPLQDDSRGGLMTPIEGSVATDGRSDDGRSETPDEAQMTGEQRRDIERRRLEEEERRVETAAREYKSRMAEREAAGSGGIPPPRSIGGVTRASTIQNKVKSLLAENEKPQNVQKTAQGYGKYTDGVGEQARAFEVKRSDPGLAKPTNQAPVAAARKAVVVSQVQGQSLVKAKAPPGAPPKPQHLVANLPPSKPSFAQHQMQQPGTPSVPAPRASIGGNVPVNAGDMGAQEMARPRDGWSASEKEGYLQGFKKRYPSLSGIEMVETVVGGQNRDTA